MGFRPIFIFDDGERAGNAEVYATEAEAMNSALARFQVWIMPCDYDAEEIDAPVNYRWNIKTHRGEPI